MKRVMAVLAIMVTAPKYFRRGADLGKYIFAARVSGRLFELGLDVKRLPVLAHANFFIEASAIHKVDRGFHPKRLAMRFFTWYCVENTNFDSRPFLREGVLIESISIMRSWAVEKPDLAQAAEREIHRIVMYLYEGFGNLDIEKAEQFHAQLLLLEVAANKQAIGGSSERI